MKKYLLIAIIVVASFLRLWKLSAVPVSLFGDELDVGYHAYSILKTGKDYYGNSWPIHFHSIAEWRTPLYLYSAVPTVAVFGVSPLGVRLPAAIFGILSVLVMYLLVKELLSYGQPPAKFHPRALLAAAVMAVNPWSLQYSRAGFEVTLLLLLLLSGLYFFFRSLKSGRWLWLSMTCFALTPWVYSTAKLFTPILLVFLAVIWWKEILVLPKRSLFYAAVALMLVGLPIAVNTLWGGGSQRFSYISIFSDPTTEPEVGVARGTDAKMRGENGVGLTPTLLDRIIHNKYTFWGKNVLNNYVRSFSTDFLFVKGDIIPRHSIGTGEFFKVEAIALIFGLIFFFAGKRDVRIKLLIAFWILAGVIPAAITREGANHATRLILILPPLILLIAYGTRELFRFGRLPTFLYLAVWLLGIGVYLHNYYVHYPWESERWWHAGWGEAITSVKEVEGDYDKVAISMAGEPAWIFFAGHYMYPPVEWQNNFPIGNDIDLSGFGKVSHIGKFYFGSPGGGLYEWGQVLDSKTLYLANASEVKVNLILEPDRKPGDLNLIKAITFPSGEPAFYLFSGK
ncbi:MAG: hypothetical protein UX13_C0021G0002 [Candidatus Woesebacteria bacterium GW2011_GWB1_45_5]|uniref:Glycosyltransferase RgtA/B/C/D-like domain-containing protein n=1 Tax=Candidatus Woesebacteria bacterium GW2011_GWB1_45_5 TaxID=1618581 RepID=A0A0G1MPN6_9BACT|nr:MAG: hypothetical protein UX13_C0021G0002 [Candidatus Woesebacteria bacterium GW2011_GWB1_45_5]